MHSITLRGSLIMNELNLQTLTLSDIFYETPNITIPIDLFVIAEMGKYSFEMFNTPIDIDELDIFEPTLGDNYGTYFTYAIKKGWLVSTKYKGTPNTYKVQDILLSDRVFKGKYKRTINIDKDIQHNSMYNWSISFEHNSSILNLDTKLVLVSLCAKHLILKHYYGVPATLTISITDNLIINPYNVAYILEYAKQHNSFFMDFLLYLLRRSSVSLTITGVLGCM